LESGRLLASGEFGAGGRLLQALLRNTAETVKPTRHTLVKIVRIIVRNLTWNRFHIQRKPEAKKPQTPGQAGPPGTLGRLSPL